MHVILVITCRQVQCVLGDESSSTIPWKKVIKEKELTNSDQFHVSNGVKWLGDRRLGGIRRSWAVLLLFAPCFPRLGFLGPLSFESSPIPVPELSRELSWPCELLERPKVHQQPAPWSGGEWTASQPRVTESWGLRTSLGPALLCTRTYRFPHSGLLRWGFCLRLMSSAGTGPLPGVLSPFPGLKHVQVVPSKHCPIQGPPVCLASVHGIHQGFLATHLLACVSVNVEPQVLISTRLITDQGDRSGEAGSQPRGCSDSKCM